MNFSNGQECLRIDTGNSLMLLKLSTCIKNHIDVLEWNG